MKKWKVTFEGIVEAETREEAWKISRKVCKQYFDELMEVISIPQDSLPKPDEWVAVNDKEYGVKIS